MEVFRSEVRSGILILVSAVILAVGIFLISDIRSFWEHKREIVVLFKYADGISKGSPVWYAGMEVGEVTKVALASEREDRIALSLRVEPQVRVRRDSRAYIRSLGMMGAKYVELSPGSPEAAELQPGEWLEGETPVSMSEILETGQRIARGLEETLGEIQGMIREIRAGGGIPQTVQSAAAFLEELRQRNRDLESIFRRVDELLASSQSSMKRLSVSIEGVAQQLNSTLGRGGDELVAFLQELRETNRSLQERMANLEANILPVLGFAREGLMEAKGLVGDARHILDVNDQNLYLLLLQLEETSRHLQALSEDLRAHPWKIVWKGDGDLSLGGPSKGTEEWRSKGRVGRHGKE
ncbi:MAG: MlaD family protein [bacterium]